MMTIYPPVDLAHALVDEARALAVARATYIAEILADSSARRRAQSRLRKSRKAA